MEKCCLSIQSHVVYGYVGQKCAVFPLQLHGFNVCPINSVQLSTHTGYQAIKGQRLSGDDLQVLADGLEANGVLSFATHILTGYIANESFLRTVAQLVQKVRSSNPDAVYVCDPVLGDDGKLYVPADLIPVYRSVSVPLATILTPNQTEAEALTGMKITDLSSAVAAMNALHALGSRTVVLTSTDLSQADLAQHVAARTAHVSKGGASALPAAEAGSRQEDLPALQSPERQGEGTGTMLLLASCPWEDVQAEVQTQGGIFYGRTQAQDGAAGHAVFAAVIHKLPASFTGTGDLTAALLLANHQKHVAEARAQGGKGSATNFVRAVESTLASLQQVCRATMARAEQLSRETERARGLLQSHAGTGSSPGGGEQQGSTPELVRARCLVEAAERGLPRGYTPEQQSAGSLAPVQSFHELNLIGCKGALVDPAVPADIRAVPVLL